MSATSGKRSIAIEPQGSHDSRSRLGMACLSVSACAADPGDPDKTGPHGSANSGNSTTSGYGATGASSGSSGSASGSGFVSGSGSTSGAGSTSAVSTLTADGSSGPGPIGDATVVVPLSPLEVDYFTIDTAPASAMQIQCRLQVENRGTAPVSLSEVTLRYWFTSDGNALSGLYFQSYYAQNLTGFLQITSAVSGTFVAAPTANVTSMSDTYLEIAFTADGGDLPPGGGATVQVDIRGPGANGYSDSFDETNDYSFDSTKTVTYQPWPHVTAYVAGQIAWGSEPGAGTSAGSADAEVEATAPDQDAVVNGGDAGPEDAAGAPFDATLPSPDAGAPDASPDSTDAADLGDATTVDLGDAADE